MERGTHTCFFCLPVVLNRSHEPRQVTDAVHAKGSYIFLQLWALGRAADIDVLERQDPPSPYVSASSVALSGKPKPPRPLTEEEIQDYITTYAKAASNAVHGAGFDGVEVHAANGYLLDQFLQTVSNNRTDRWAGDEEGRTRFAREVVDAVVEAVGEDRVGLRISPWSTFQGVTALVDLNTMCSHAHIYFPDMAMPDPRPTFAYLATALRDKHPRMAYLHVVEPRVSGIADAVPSEGANNDFLREIWNEDEGDEERVFISAGGHTRETALRTAETKGGLVAFGRLYISNVSVSTFSVQGSYIDLDPVQPDLPARLQENVPLTRSDRSKFYLVGDMTPLGYNDWSFADGTVREIEGEL